MCVKPEDHFEMYRAGQGVYEDPVNIGRWPHKYLLFDVLQGTACAENSVCIDNKCTDVSTKKPFTPQRWSEQYDYGFDRDYPCKYKCFMTYYYYARCSITVVDLIYGRLDSCLATEEVKSKCEEACKA